MGSGQGNLHPRLDVVAVGQKRNQLLCQRILSPPIVSTHHCCFCLRIFVWINKSEFSQAIVEMKGRSDSEWSHLPFSMCSTLGSIAVFDPQPPHDTIWATWWSWLCLAFGWWQVLELQCPKARVIPCRLMKWLVMCLKHHVPRQIFGMRRDMCRRVRAAAIAWHHVRTPRILATTTILLQALATTWQPTKWAVMLRKHHALRPMFGMRLASCLAGPAAATASSPVRMCQIPATTMTFQMRRLHLPPPHPDLPGVVMMCLRTPATVMCRRQSVQGLGPDPARIVWGMPCRHQPLNPTARCWS